MAFYQARSGVCRSGVTYCGWTPPLGVLKVNGVDRSALWQWENTIVNLKADGTPATFSFTITPDLNDATSFPVEGQDVALFYATPNDYIVAGTILQMELVKWSRTVVVYRCTATGYQWLLDRYDLVRATYSNVGIGHAVGDILQRFTNGGFRIGYVQDLGNITMTFTRETVTGALNRLAKAKNAVWEVLPFDGVSRIVNLYQTYPEQTQITVTGDNIWYENSGYKVDLTQVRTRCLFVGQGTTASAPSGPNSGLIAVDDVSIFNPVGGQVAVGVDIVTYAGLFNNGDGTGQLFVVSGLTADVVTGEAINVLTETIDAGAQTALATQLGGGLSGQATNSLQDERLSSAETSARGTTDIAVFGTSLKDARWTYSTAQRWLRVGRTVTLNIAVPVISGSFLVREIQIEPLGKLAGQFTGFKQTASGSRFVRSILDLLAQLPG